jgi:hypothetical protein
VPLDSNEIGRELLCENVPEYLGPEDPMYTGSHLVGGRSEDYEPRQVILDEPSHFFFVSCLWIVCGQTRCRRSQQTVSIPAADSNSTGHVKRRREDRLDEGGSGLAKLNDASKSDQVGWGDIVRYKRPVNHRRPGNRD